jgi:hypothetical protein
MAGGAALGVGARRAAFVRDKVLDLGERVHAGQYGGVMPVTRPPAMALPEVPNGRIRR